MDTEKYPDLIIPALLVNVVRFLPPYTLTHICIMKSVFLIDAIVRNNCIIHMGL